MKIFKKPYPDTTGYALYFMCPACKELHGINHTWEFNEDYENPTITPSIRVRGHDSECHTWITNGKVKFFSDCSHELAGKKWIDLPEIPDNIL